MNSFCNQLQLNLQPLVDSFDLSKINQYHSKAPIENLNPEFTKLLDSLGLEINLIPIFYTYPYQQTPIHADGKGITQDFIKLNFVINEADSYMIWYKPNIKKLQVSSTGLNTPYISYNINEVVEVHRQQLNGCALVQVAVPHNVEVYTKPRYCISLPLWKKGTGSAVTMSEGLEIFKDYLVPHPRLERGTHSF